MPGLSHYIVTSCSKPSCPGQKGTKMDETAFWDNYDATRTIMLGTYEDLERGEWDNAVLPDDCDDWDGVDYSHLTDNPYFV